METILGGLAFVGFLAAHLFAVVALRDARADEQPAKQRDTAPAAIGIAAAPEAR
jgi:hypothetical protein